MKLSKRLQQLDAMVAYGYDHIWDCCCDHGLLGAALVARRAAAKVHFVDVVPALMRQLSEKLAHFYPECSSLSASKHAQWQVHCMDVADLSLHSYSGKHLVIIAGVGGDLMAALVAAICERHAGMIIDFLVCPVHHQFTFRQQLIALNCQLRDEILVVENQRYYEILWVSTAANNVGMSINAVGSLLWQTHTPAQRKMARDYLATTLAHYQRMQLNGRVNVQPIIAAYQAITL